MRVGAVGNAVCAFSKVLWAPLCASTTPAASMRSASSLAPPCGLNPSGPFIEAAEPHWTEMEIPLAVVHGFQPNPFADQHRTDHDGLRVPRHHARRRYAAHFIVAWIDHRRQPVRQRPRRGLIEPSGGPLPQGFMRALLVSAGVALDPITCGPTFDAVTYETNVRGLYTAGAVVAGRESGKIFIENGRFHGEQVVKAIVESLIPHR
jgi:hypothetical protein